MIGLYTTGLRRGSGRLTEADPQTTRPNPEPYLSFTAALSRDPGTGSQVGEEGDQRMGSEWLWTSPELMEAKEKRKRPRADPRGRG